MTLAGPGLCVGGSETKRSYGRTCREWVWIKVVEGGLGEQFCEALKEKTSVMWFPVAFILLRRIWVLGSAESTWVIRGFPHSVGAVGTGQNLLPRLDWDVGCLGIRGTWILSWGTGEPAWSLSIFSEGLLQVLMEAKDAGSEVSLCSRQSMLRTKPAMCAPWREAPAGTEWGGSNTWFPLLSFPGCRGPTKEDGVSAAVTVCLPRAHAVK